MRKVLLPIATVAAVSAAVLFIHRAEAAPSAAPGDIAATIGSTSAVEPAACFRRRVCGPRGCAWRTVCRRRW
jgi:hypothetical protein